MICGGTMFGKLRHRQDAQRHEAAEHGDDGDHDRDDGPADEEVGHGYRPAGVCRWRCRSTKGFVVTLVPGAERARIDDHLVAGAQALVDDPARADPFAEGHRPDLDGVVGCHDAHLERSLEFRHRALRHEQDLAARPVSPRSRRPYCPGRSWLCGFGNVALIRIVPVFGSICRSAARKAPFRDTPGRRRGSG